MDMLLNPRSVKEIQAMRELESMGDLQEQMDYLYSIVKGDSETPEKLAIEITQMMASMQLEIYRVVAELTEIMASIGGSDDVSV